MNSKNKTPLKPWQEPVTAKYGAPMGRTYVCPDADDPVSLVVEYVELFDGDYDEGGAYWGGSGDPLWCVYNPDGPERLFCRASSKADVRKKIRKCHPAVKFK